MQGVREEIHQVRPSQQAHQDSREEGGEREGEEEQPGLLPGPRQPDGQVRSAGRGECARQRTDQTCSSPQPGPTLQTRTSFLTLLQRLFTKLFTLEMSDIPSL